MAYERGRMPKVKAFLSARLAGEATDTILDMAARTLGESRQTLATLWRARVLRYQGPQDVPRNKG